MRLHHYLTATLLAVSVAACDVGRSGDSSTPSLALPAHQTNTAVTALRSCARLRKGDSVRCDALVGVGRQSPTQGDAKHPSGFSPAELRSAYAIPDGGSGRTVAIVDAYDDPNAEADLAVYRRHFALPPCTTKNRCFKKVAQDGRNRLPPPDSGWAQEISLDLDMVSAICPNCRIVLVEGKAATLGSLQIAESTAGELHADVISNSYSQAESKPGNVHYDRSPAIVVASSGDSGTGAREPCVWAHVVCVGGTTLVKSSSVARGWSETAWELTGSGCSGLVKKPAWQTDTGCPNRSEVDVSAVANPSTGVAAYDSIPQYGESGWLRFGGTSVATPIVAGIYAIAADVTSRDAAARLWHGIGTAAFNDVLTGTNGSCSPVWLYICTARSGYDGPTGMGTPDGVTAF